MHGMLVSCARHTVSQGCDLSTRRKALQCTITVKGAYGHVTEERFALTVVALRPCALRGNGWYSTSAVGGEGGTRYRRGVGHHGAARQGRSVTGRALHGAVQCLPTCGRTAAVGDAGGSVGGR